MQTIDKNEDMKCSLKLLVVDDEQIMLTLMDKILTADGYQVLQAENGQIALDILEYEAVDIIISDLQMPKLDGFELLEIVKEKYPDIGMIMMTAHGDTFTVKSALMLGADEYITKPFKSFEISMVVERAYWRLISNNKISSSVI